MRASVVAATTFVLQLTAALCHAQGLLARPTAQHATVVGSASEASVAPGGAVTLWADVSPYPSIRIYAEGAADFTPVSLVTTPNAAVTPGKPKYPKADLAASPGTSDVVPAYKQTFRIALPASISSKARPGDVITIGGAVNYQACDDRLCYPVAIAPITWKLTVR